MEALRGLAQMMRSTGERRTVPYTLYIVEYVLYVYIYTYIHTVPCKVHVEVNHTSTKGTYSIPGMVIQYHSYILNTKFHFLLVERVNNKKCDIRTRRHIQKICRRHDAIIGKGATLLIRLLPFAGH
jgi:hypothetical protein